MTDFKKRFRKKRKIAEGQFGTVYEVEEKTSGKIFALKEICFNDRNKGIIEREIALQSRFSHSNLLKLESAHFEMPYAFIVTEFCKHDLRAFLQRSVFPLKSELKRSLIKDIVRGLTVLHGHGIYHRDLKPANILIGDDLTAKIGDFGSAISEDERIDGRFDPQGFTLWYKAPELLMGERGYGAEIDIWSLGCVAAELFHGAPIFPCASEFELLDHITAFLGEPTPQNWPRLEETPNYGKVTFLPRPPAALTERFPCATASELDFVRQCVRYGARPSAHQLLSHDLIRDYTRCDTQEFKENFIQASSHDFFTLFCSKFS